MPGSLACILSAGLTCTPAKLEVVKPPPPTPLEPAAADPPEPAPDKGAATLLLAKVQSFYDGTKDIKANFTQTYIHPVYGTKKTSEGKLRALKPGKMIWDYDKETNPDFWVDGSNVWVVERDTKQVVKKSIGSSDVAGAEKFLFGGKELMSDFQIQLANETLEKRYGMKDHTAVRLKPKKKNAHYREIMLIVDDGSGRVDAFVVLNQDKSSNHFKLTGLARNSGLAGGDFKFKKPAGYTEIQG